MTNRLELNWKLDGFVDEQRYYCSETPIDVNSLPAPKVILDSSTRSYIDADIEIGKTYYIRLGSVKNSIEKISDETKIVIATNDLQLTFRSPSFVDEIKKTEWAVVGSDYQFVEEESNKYSIHLKTTATSSPNYFSHVIDKTISSSDAFIAATELSFDFSLFDLNNYNALFMFSKDENTDTDRLQLMLENSNWTLYATRGSAGALTHSFKNTFSINTWYRAKLIFSEKKIEIFIDDSLVTTANFVGNLPSITSTHKLIIGTARNASTRRTSRCKFMNIKFKNS